MIVSLWVRPDKKSAAKEFAITKAFSTKYKTYKNLNEWKGPHITLFTLNYKSGDFDNLLETIRNVAKSRRPFRVRIKDLGYFMKNTQFKRRNYVIYFKVMKDKNLSRFWSSLNRKIEKYKKPNLKYKNSKLSFTPHMTIAYWDLTKENFYKARKEYRNFKFRESFLLKEIQVSRRIGRKRRKQVTTIKLGS